MHSLKNKKILVTGAAGGLGQILVKWLLNADARVVALVKDHSSAKSLTKHDGLELMVVDLADAAAVEASVAQSIEASGPFFALVNNAAIYPKSLITDLERDELRRVLEVNAIAGAGLVKLCAPHMRDSGGGRIVNITSNTFDMGMQELSAYVGSKGAMIGMTRVWARELGPWNISVNAVSPGAFQTDAEKIHPDPEKYSEFVISQQAIKRRGSPEEFAALIEFLLGDHSAFITGQTIRIDGGWITQ